MVCCCLVTKLYLTLCDRVDCSPPGSSVHGILQARIQEWVAISSSREFSWPKNQTYISCIVGRFFATEPLGKPLRIWLLSACFFNNHLIPQKGIRGHHLSMSQAEFT